MAPILSRVSSDFGFGKKTAAAGGVRAAAPIMNTSDDAGQILSSGVRNDPYASSLVLAIPFNTLTDESPTGRVNSTLNISTVGSVSSNTTSAKFYGTTHLWSGSGTNYILASDTSNFNFGLGDFTIECWYHMTASRPQGTYNIVCSVFSDAGQYSSAGAWHAYVNTSDNKTGMYRQGTGNFTVNYTFPLNQWVHVAYVRTGSTLKIYHDGVGQTASTSANVTFANPYANGLLIGRLNPTDLGGTTGQHQGYMQDLRLYSTNKYTADFTP